jgi:hypothetical protein
MSRSVRTLAAWTAVATAVALVTFLPATGITRGRPAQDRTLAHISQAPVLRYWMAHPGRAPESFQQRFRSFQQAAGQGSASSSGAVTTTGVPSIVDDVLNNDVVGFPQNEESVSGCRSNTDHLIEGTNDYRGLLDPEGNFTGWHLSTDGGETLANEGLLPPVEAGGTKAQPSGGDPVYSFSEVDCDIYAASLNYNPVDPFSDVNGIGIYRTKVSTLLARSCGDDGASDPDCWPRRRYASFTADPTHFFDKEWFDVGVSGGAGEVVWVVYSDFDLTPVPPNPAGFTAEIFAVRCDADLTSCTSPIPISEDDGDVQFGDVTIAPDGKVYVTWSQITGELEGEPQTFIHKMRVADAGSTTFGPEREIRREQRAIPFGGFLHANDFRVATYPKNEVMPMGGGNRVYVVWDACRFRPLSSICEEPQIKLLFSDDDGVTWEPSQPLILSESGDNYFPAIGGHPATGDLAVAWFTNRQDDLFHSLQDVELVTLDPDGDVTNRQILTSPSNESLADPLLGGVFIGDYIEVFTHDGTAWTGYNMNYRQEVLLGNQGVPVPQQDNYLTDASLE